MDADPEDEPCRLLRGREHHLERIDDRLRELSTSLVVEHEGGNVVQFRGVRHGEHRRAACVERCGLLVVAPVEQIGEPELGEQARRVRRLGQGGTQPAPRPHPRRPLDRLDDVAQVRPLRLLVHADLKRRVVLAVRHPRPSALHPGSDDLGVLAARVRVERSGDGHRQAVEGVDKSPDSDARPVVAPALVQRIGLERGRALEQRDRGLAALVMLHVERHVDGEASAVRPLELRTLRQRRMAVRPVAHLGAAKCIRRRYALISQLAAGTSPRAVSITKSWERVARSSSSTAAARQGPISAPRRTDGRAGPTGSRNVASSAG